MTKSMRVSWRTKYLCGASLVSVALMGVATGAHAQAEGGAVDEVVITGSRIIRDGSQQPTPVTVVGAEQLRDTAPVDIADGLRQLPQFRGAPSTNVGQLSSNYDTGANILSLRNLGASRTLVLLDGHRVISPAGSDNTDTNTFPQQLVSRVETVTGGASAAYGSDAVAGVVNFIIDKEFVGIKGAVQAGISTYEDAVSTKFNLSAGSRFLDDRLHVMFSGEYATKAGVGPYNTGRDWQEIGFGQIQNPSYNPNDLSFGPARLTYADGVTGSGATYGGLITSAYLPGIQFGPGGTAQPFFYGTNRSTLTHVNGDGPIDRTAIAQNVDRHSLYGRVSYDVTDSMRVYASAIYSASKSLSDFYYSFFISANTPTIYLSNAFIPEATRQALAAVPMTATQSNLCRRTAQGVAPTGSAFTANDPLRCFQMGRINTENMMYAYQDKAIYQILLGVNGEFSNGWNYDAFFNYGNAKATRGVTEMPHMPKMMAAVDAIRDTNGAIKCSVLVPTAQRPTTYAGAPYDQAVADRFAGCVPLNLIGEGSPSQAAWDWINDEEYVFIARDQYNAGLSISGALPDWTQIGYEVPRFATGVEYREEQVLLTTTANTQEVVNYAGVRGGLTARNGTIGPFLFGNYQPHQNAAAGPSSYSTKEFFAEVEVPIFKDAPLAHLLDFNAAYRLTDYSSSGRVNTWKVGAVYEPIEGVRFRGTKSRDIRGPNVDELFSGTSTTTSNTPNPFVPGTTITYTIRNGGNPNLRPEVADTETIGLVLSPTFLPGFRISADYYNIRIQDAIGTLGVAAIVDQCYKGSAERCAQITQQPGLWFIDAVRFNQNEEFVQGWDFEAGYRFDLAGGRADLRFLANYQPTNKSDVPGSPIINRAGQAGDSAEITAVASANYSIGRYSVTLQEQYISASHIDNTWVEGRDIDNNDVPAYMITHFNAKADFGENNQYEAFLSINNLFNKAPPLAPSTTGIRMTRAPGVYDTIGRYFTVGLRFKL